MNAISILLSIICLLLIARNDATNGMFDKVKKMAGSALSEMSKSKGKPDSGDEKPLSGNKNLEQQLLKGLHPSTTDFNARYIPETSENGGWGCCVIEEDPSKLVLPENKVDLKSYTSRCCNVCPFPYGDKPAAELTPADLERWTNGRPFQLETASDQYERQIERVFHETASFVEVLSEGDEDQTDENSLGKPKDLPRPSWRNAGPPPKCNLCDSKRSNGCCDYCTIDYDHINALVSKELQYERFTGPILS